VKVLIIGAGKHAQVVADILLRMRERGEAVEPVGYVDDKPALAGQEILGLRVLGTTGEVGRLAHDAVVVAIGDNATRRRLFEQLRQAGERFITARHPQTVVAPDVVLGEGTMVSAGVVVNTGSVVGANVILNTSCSVDHHSRVGDHVHVAPGVRLGGQVVVADGALVGIGATVVARRRIGAWSVIGAGALVHHDVPDGAVSVGHPARVVGNNDAGDKA